MSLTAIAFLGIYAAFLLLALLRRPIYGLFGYMWAFYLNPTFSWWGSDLPDLRWSLVAAVVTLIATLMRNTNSRPADATTPPDQAAASARPGVAPRRWHANWGARLLIVFVAWMWVQTFWAVNPTYHVDGCILFTKYVILFYAIYRLIPNETHLELFAWAHVLGCFIWGWIAYRTEVQGRLELALGPGVDDSNVLGFHAATGLAFAGLMFLGLPGKRRWVAFGTIPFILNAVILTASRSALLAMGAGGVAAALLAPKRYRGRLLAAGALGLVLLFMLAGNDVFWERAATITTTAVDEMDASAASRITILKNEWKMAQDYPLGAGHRGNEVLSSRYVPVEMLTSGGVRSAHNTFMAVLVDEGAPGLLIYLAVTLWAFVRLWRLKLLDRVGLPPSLGLYRAAVGAGLGAYLASSLFINLTKIEVGLWLIALLSALDNICRAVLEGGKPAPGPVKNVIDVRKGPLRTEPRSRGIGKIAASQHVNCASWAGTCLAHERRGFFSRAYSRESPLRRKA